ncbi:MAG: hypothetical protein OEY85_02730 [Rhodospirillales bacterium]|nr:hypothetical protein [Rhodospirillales bacterium]
MDQGIWATWYDLPAEGRGDYLEWLHGTHLPMIAARPGIAWAAHYEITGGGVNMDKIGARLARADEPGLGTGTQFVVLVGASSPHVFFRPDITKLEPDLNDRARNMLGRRVGSRVCIFTEEARINGPEYDQHAPGATPGPAIQMGSFRTRSLEDEYDLAAWYAQYRLPAMARMPGCIATRKLVSLVGWAKHSVLYEFLSLEEREKHFQNHESLALDEKEWTNRIITYTVHAPGSPSVGRRIWPAVE